MSNNYSKQREIVLETIKNTYIHPTAEQIYEMVSKIDSRISKSTVYRNINILVEKEQIEKISMKLGPDRFDYIHKPHHHAVCEICGKVVDFNYELEKNKIIKSIKEQTGFETKLNCITIYGICEKCKSKNKF